MYPFPLKKEYKCVSQYGEDLSCPLRQKEMMQHKNYFRCHSKKYKNQHIRDLEASMCFCRSTYQRTHLNPIWALRYLVIQLRWKVTLILIQYNSNEQLSKYNNCLERIKIKWSLVIPLTYQLSTSTLSYFDIRVSLHAYPLCLENEHTIKGIESSQYAWRLHHQLHWSTSCVHTHKHVHRLTHYKL